MTCATRDSSKKNLLHHFMIWKSRENNSQFREFLLHVIFHHK